MSAVHRADDVQEAPAPETYPHTGRQDTFLHHALIVIGVAALTVVLLWILWQALNVVLLIFGGILLAVLLRAISDGIKHVTHLPDQVSIGITILVLLALAIAMIGWMGPRIISQFSQLGPNLGNASEQLGDAIAQYSWGEQVLAWIPSLEQLLNSAQDGLDGQGLLSRVTGIFSRTLEALSSFLIILFVGIFFTFDPGLYMRGLVKLFPHNRRERVWEVLRAEEHTLRWWLLGTLISMLNIGIITWLILWFFDVPLAFTLGFLTALLEFIPIIGPFVATVPVVLMAFTVSPQTALWVLILYTILQILESNVVLPIILKKAVELPPVITLTSQVLLGILTGALGVLLATPLAAATLVLVQMVYVEDVLGEPVEVKKTEN